MSMSSSSIRSDPSQEFQEFAVERRDTSLANLWIKKPREVKAAFDNREFQNQFECILLGPSNTPGTNAIGIVRSDGLLQLFSRTQDNEHLASISLPSSLIVGDSKKSIVQVRGPGDMLLELFINSELFAPVCATFFTWSRMRTQGLPKKIWYPPPPQIRAETDHKLHASKVQAYLSVDDGRPSWAHYTVLLDTDGYLKLRKSDENGDHDTRQLRLDNMRSTQIQKVHPSLEFAHSRVIMLFPDTGERDAIYLKFDELQEYEDWAATLKIMSRLTVTAPLSRDPKKSVRWINGLTVKIGSCEQIDPEWSTYQPEASDISDTYVDIYLDGWNFARTNLNEDRTTAIWNQTFEFNDVESDGLHPIGFRPQYNLKRFRGLTLKLNRKISHHSNPSVIGFVEVPPTIPRDSWQWLTLSDSNLKLQVQITSPSTAIMHSTKYEALEAQFTDLKLDAASRLVRAYPSILPSAAPLFCKLYRAHGQQLEWMRRLASQEIRTMDLESDTLFRGTSLFVKSMESLLQQQGIGILNRTIGLFIQKIRDSNVRLELDPSKGVNDSELMANRVMMYDHMRELWGYIQFEGVPPYAKVIFRHMADELKSRGLDEVQIDRVMSRTLSAFVFLRFYCPALTNPEVLNLTKRTLDRSNRRILVLAAKILQSFANKVQFGTKEAWLKPMNGFIVDFGHELSVFYERIYRDNRTPPISKPGSIRRVPVPPTSEPIPWKPPSETFMGEYISGPALLDPVVICSDLSSLIDRECCADGEKNTDEVVDEVLRLSHKIAAELDELLTSLDNADTFEDSVMAPAPHFLIKESLFGLDEELLEHISVIQSPAGNRLASNGSGRPPSASESKTSSDFSKMKPGSVRKLMNRLRISKSPGPEQ